MKVSSSIVRLALAAAAALALGACATSTQLNAQWVNPVAGKHSPIKSVMVMGVTRDTTSRRIFEDTMVAALAARGIKAVPSYLKLPADEAAPQPAFEKVVREAGVENVLLSRLVSVTNETVVTPGFVDRGPVGWGGFYSSYNAMWRASMTTQPRVETVQNFAVDTQLFNINDLTVIWSGTTTTTPFNVSMQRTISQFVDVIVAAMKENRLI